MGTAGILRLEADDWLLKIDADRGGQICECRWRGLEVFTTAKAGVWPADAHAGCFPLVPYSNRIRQASFSFDGRAVSLPAAEFAMPHALHGLGWRRAWKRQVSGNDEVILTQTNIGGPWPWPYQARQHVRLKGNTLTLTLSIENTGAEPMPAGIGLHPYFPRRPGLAIGLRAGGQWQSDASAPGIPTYWTALNPDEDILGRERLEIVDLDNCFTDWNRTARLDYRDTKLAVELSASETLQNIVVYCPADRNVLCLEPVSHINNALNQPGLNLPQRIDRLEPGQCLTGTMRIEVSQSI